MDKCSITDCRWVADAIGGLVFLTVTGVFLYVWLTSMHPFPSLLSVFFYYAVLCALVGAVLFLCAKGFTYRWTEVSHEGLVVHEGLYGLIWKQRLIPRSEISAVDRYDVSRAGFPGGVRFSEIRVRLIDGSTLVLAVADGLGKCHREVAEVRRILGIPGDG